MASVVVSLWGVVFDARKCDWWRFVSLFISLSLTFTFFIFRLSSFIAREKQNLIF